MIYPSKIVWNIGGVKSFFPKLADARALVFDSVSAFKLAIKKEAMHEYTI